MRGLNPMLITDFYKVGRENQYPPNTTKIVETWTPRGTRIPEIKDVTFFGLQSFIKKYLIDYFNEEFFEKDISKITDDYKRVLKGTLQIEDANVSHIENLHKLGYLPIKIMAIPEGMETPIRVPQMTIENTHDDFYWLPNFLETLLSSELWHSCTSASIAKEYRGIMMKYSNKTCDNDAHIGFQCHGFEMRGMVGMSGWLSSASAHLLSFDGSDTVPGYAYMEEYYNADLSKELVIGSIPATEHLVETCYPSDEEYIRAMIEDVYPRGLVSVVMDGYDYWSVLSETLPKLKDKIMSRDGKLVVRGDSGDPVKIIAGDKDSDCPHAKRGTVELLWDIFGGTVNEKGYKILDSHIGTIYGDAITRERAEAILSQLEEKGFAASNVVFGVGSYTYQYNTRDTFAYSLKTVHAVINGREKMIFKDPKTDSGLKKSQKGCVAVGYNNMGEIIVQDGLTLKQRDDAQWNLMRTVYENGKLLIDDSLAEIRKRIRK